MSLGKIKKNSKKYWNSGKIFEHFKENFGKIRENYVMYKEYFDIILKILWETLPDEILKIIGMKIVII